MCGLEILDLHTRCHEGLFAYHKTNGIIAMKEHVDVEHKSLFAKYMEHATSSFRYPLHWEQDSKRPHVTPNAISIYFFVVLTHLQKTMAQKNASYKMLCYMWSRVNFYH
jgi:hypothetical protein